jgi:Domain of unknown function (DUF4157)
MASFEQRARTGTPGTQSSPSSQAVPGKRTLTEAIPAPTPVVQRKAAGSADGSNADVHAAAARGTSGAGGALPHRDAIQASFGSAFDVSTIRGHVGGASAEACSDIGAAAFATGKDVAFRQAPDLHTAAHEAAHVAQQAQGVHLYGGVGEAGDRYERHADAVADRVVAGQSAADLLGGGPASGAGHATAVQRKDEAAPDPDLDPLLSGALQNKGQGTDLGYTFVFANGQLDQAFKKLCTHWSIPLFPDIDGGAAPAAPGTKPKSGGDSEGKGVAKLPAWFNAMQNKVIGSTTWSRVEKATQALLDAFLRANFPSAPASVNVFFDNVGKSETNKASDEMVPGSTNSGVWCAQASSVPLLKALNDAGYRFKARTAPSDMPWAKMKKGDLIPVQNQGALYSAWSADNPGKGDPTAPPRTIGGAAASTAVLEPGDVFSLVSQATPSSGHVGTVVEFKDPVITMVSGNAGGAAPGQGAIRIEDVVREPMPSGAYWDTSGTKKELGKTNPAKAGVCWVVSIQKTSQLDPQALAALKDDALAKLGLERTTVSA